MTGALSAHTAAQDRPPADTIETSRPGPVTASVPSVVSLERIRLALKSEPRLALPDSEDLRSWDRRPSFELSDDLDVVWGADLFGGAGGPVQYGAPTHQEMMRVRTPRWFTEGRPSDALGMASASAFALVPHAIKTIAGWLSGQDGDNGPEHPILTPSEEILALAYARTGGHVLDATIRQRGRTIDLWLVVRPTTSLTTARALGERLLVLVKAFSAVEPDPDDKIGAGEYDYIVKVSSPTDTVIALGAKATTDTTLTW